MANLQTLLEWQTVPQKAVRLFRSQPLEKINEALEKRSFNALGELGEYLQWFPGKTFGIPSQPSPLASMLVGGLTGAGLGYGGGMLAEAIMPDTWQRKRARRTFGMLGGLLGAAPGLMWGATNLSGGRPFFDNTVGSTPAREITLGPGETPMFGPYKDWDQRWEGPGSEAHLEIGPETKMGMFDRPLAAVDLKPLAKPIKAAEVARSIMEKLAFGTTGLFGAPTIDVDQFNDTVWRDPEVAGRLTPPQQAAASGLVTGAANLPGKWSPRFVTPLDMGRMAVGMGSGFVSGAIVGKVLGLLLGMPQESQDRLKQTGVMAGAIANALPIIYG